jgi:hypothetical protein
MRLFSLGAAIVVGLPAVAPTAAAQTLRQFSVERSRRDETSLRVIVDFAAGELFVRPSSSAALSRLDLAYDDARYGPVGHYDPAGGTVRLGVDTRPERTGLPRDQLPQRASSAGARTRAAVCSTICTVIPFGRNTRRDIAGGQGIW